MIGENMESEIRKFTVLWANSIEFTISIDVSIWTAEKLQTFLEDAGVHVHWRSYANGTLFFTPNELLPVFFRQIAEDILPAIPDAPNKAALLKRLQEIPGLPVFGKAEGIFLTDFEFYSFDDKDLEIFELDIC